MKTKIPYHCKPGIELVTNIQQTIKFDYTKELIQQNAKVRVAFPQFWYMFMYIYTM